MAGLPWFKLAGDFFAHPKTLELQAEIQDPAADVYVVRMWAYVSRVAASGRLQGRNVVTVLERAVGWQGEPGRLAAALLQVGFLQQEPDALIVHDWAAWQGAHVAKVDKDRARPNAKTRVSYTSADPARGFVGVSSGSRDNPGVETEREIENKEETTMSTWVDLQVPLLQVVETSADKPADLQALWNVEAHESLPRWQGMSDTRKRRAAARLREKPLDKWREVIRRLSASPFCRGEEGGTGWRASPDWLLQPDTADKVLEGKYDRPGSAPAVEAKPKAFKVL